MKKFYLILLGVLLLATNVKAESCDYETKIKISGIATNAKAEYIMNEYKNEYLDPTYDEIITDSNWGGIIYIYNMDPAIKVEVVDDNNKKYNYSYMDANSEGTIGLSTGLANVVKNYTINIYATNSECGKDPLKTVNITIPRFNRYSLYTQCQTYPDYYYCKQFVTLEDINETTFYQGIEDYQKQQEKQQEEAKKQQSIVYKTKEFVLEHKNIIIPIVIVLVIIGGLVIYMVIKKRRERLV